MRHAATTAFVTDSASQKHREGVVRENLANIHRYYNSVEASSLYPGSGSAQAPSSSHHTPSMAAQRPLGDSNTSSNTDEISRQSSIRLVPSSSKASTPRTPEVLPRPALHHADSNIVVTTNRKIAIVERDETPAARPGSPSPPGAAGSPATSILARRGLDRSRLALISPPEVAPSSQSPQSSPSTAAFALSKSSRTKYADVKTSPTNAEGHPLSHRSNHTHTHRGHGRSSSELTDAGPSHSTRSPGNIGNSSSGDISKTSRNAGMTDTTQILSRRLGLEAKTGTKHQQRESSGHASSGSDYGDESSPRRTGDVSGNKPLPSLLSQQNPTADATIPQRPVDPTLSSSASQGMRIPLPTGPRTFGSSSGQTPMLTPAIGDTKPIDFKVAAPVVVDIRSDLADLWLAATPDGDVDVSSMGTSMTATTIITDLSSMPSLSSPGDGGPTSSTSSSNVRTRPYNPELDSTAGPVPLPPRHIDINSLATNSSPVCPPRPQREQSPAKRRFPPMSHEEESASNTNKAPIVQAREINTTSSRTNSKPSLASGPDPKYALLAVSDDDSSSDYSNDAHTRKTTRSYSAAQPSPSSKTGSIHIREGAFPADSVFLERLKTDVETEQLEDEMKTPTNHNKMAHMFLSRSVQDIPSNYASSTKEGSHGRSSNELSMRKGRPHTAETPRDHGKPTPNGEPAVRPNIRAKEVEVQHNSFTWEGSDTHGTESPSEPSPDSPTDSTTPHRVYPHSHLGHGPPPKVRANKAKGPHAFRAKGPLATSNMIRTARLKKPTTNPPSMWPPAMSIADVLSEPTPLARSIGYAMKINELSKESCGLDAWIEAILNKNNPPVMTSAGLVPVGPTHLRFVSGSSAMSEMTFPIRPDAYKAVDLTPDGAEISANEVPSTLPYPVLALQQQKTGGRPAIPPIPPPKSSISSAVKSGPAGFLATLSRKASMRTKGTQSATEARDREKEPKPPPRKLVSSRAPPSRSDDTPPSTPNRSNTILPTAPTLPGGPRAPRPKRASTMMISAPRPIISAPIPIAPPAPANDGHPDSSPSDEDGPAESPPEVTAKPMKLSKEVPRPPDGPRAPRLSRTPSFPGSTRISPSGNSRSTVSFKPNASPLGVQTFGSKSAVGITTEPAQARASEEFSRDLNKLCDVLPHVPKDTLAIYLSRAGGQSMMAIGRYLEDERQGTVLKV